MSRILKRPMFRTGGTPNQGIMHGLVDRRGYSNGSKAEQFADEYYSMLSKYKPPAPRLPLGQIGLNLVSGEFAGDGFLSNVARSAKEPYSQWTQADDARRNLDYQTRMTAAKMGISKDEALQLAREKNQAKTTYAAQTPQAQYEVRSKQYAASNNPLIADNASDLASFEIRHRDQNYTQMNYEYKNKKYQPNWDNIPVDSITYNVVTGLAYKRIKRDTNTAADFVALDPFTLKPIDMSGTL